MFTTATGWLVSVSLSRNPRPFRSGIRSISKNPGVTHDSLDPSSVPARFPSRILMPSFSPRSYGALSATAALSTPGILCIDATLCRSSV